MWQNIKDEEMIEGEFKNGTVSGRAVWERQDGVRFEGVFRRGHAHGPGVVSWSDSGYRCDKDKQINLNFVLTIVCIIDNKRNEDIISITDIQLTILLRLMP